MLFAVSTYANYSVCVLKYRICPMSRKPCVFTYRVYQKKTQTQTIAVTNCQWNLNTEDKAERCSVTAIVCVFFETPCSYANLNLN